jgi:hypothetical protein
MNQVSITRCGRANVMIRRTVVQVNGRCSCWAIIMWYSEFHAAISMLMPSP